MHKKQQAGFTLIELIIVIIVLGILAITAVPRFLNLSTDANIAALEGLAGAVRSASNLTFAKANIEGVANQPSGNVDVDNDGIDDVETVFGYPSGNRTTGIANVLDLGESWAFGDTFGGTELHITSASLAGFSGITNNNIPVRGTNCYITYRPPSELGAQPTIIFITSEC
ncbi:prepilin-type N-terminal cleavage/methylation domain-containing protein [Alteromonadaceae bacterium M269]|nr:prepilin-type N-terminal cleavage/methylation domain-containing protein [Alteromonadaceae bacterium M269]